MSDEIEDGMGFAGLDPGLTPEEKYIARLELKNGALIKQCAALTAKVAEQTIDCNSLRAEADGLRDSYLEQVRVGKALVAAQPKTVALINALRMPAMQRALSMDVRCALIALEETLTGRHEPDHDALVAALAEAREWIIEVSTNKNVGAVATLAAINRALKAAKVQP